MKTLELKLGLKFDFFYKFSHEIIIMLMKIKIESQIIYLTVKRALFVIDMNLSCGAWNYKKNVWTSLVLYTTQLAGGALLRIFRYFEVMLNIL